MVGAICIGGSTLCDEYKEHGRSSFNDIASNKEKWGGRRREEWSFRDFKHFIADNDLIDVGFDGNPWTWCNNWENEGEIKQRLDRMLCTPTGFQRFDKTRCKHVDNYSSDHSMLVVDTEPVEEKRRKKFIFDKRVALLKWKNSFQHNSRKEINRIKAEMERLRESPDFNRRAMDELKIQLKRAYSNEELYWAQKSRVTWLKEGNKNSQFFHASVKGRMRRNRMSNVQRDDGTWTTNERELREEVASYYKQLFDSQGTEGVEDILRGIPNTISNQMNVNLTRTITEAEIKSALFSMNPNKAPGPDGQTPLFFQKF
ncbi:uncharacterized protein [Coffea arabica]|uniref:Uncharacterized protein n=1 Tax=Coffea arabica TaxID=13443 RepID=A0ABM4V9K3_COFAR